MLRINLLHDDRDQATASSSRSALIALVGLLVLLLCVAIALTGWLTLQNAEEAMRTDIQRAQATLQELQERRTPVDYEGLVELERHTLTLEALTKHQSRTPRALKNVFAALGFDDRSGANIVLQSVNFDGQTITAHGRARDIDTLTQALTQLQNEDGVQDARFTALSVAEEPLSGRARRYVVNAIDFSFYAAIAAPPMEAQE